MYESVYGVECIDLNHMDLQSQETLHIKTHWSRECHYWSHHSTSTVKWCDWSCHPTCPWPASQAAVIITLDASDKFIQSEKLIMLKRLKTSPRSDPSGYELIIAGKCYGNRNVWQPNRNWCTII